MSKHHAVNLISVYGPPHGTALSMQKEDGIWWFCLRISIPEWSSWSQQPPAVFQSKSNKRSDPLTHIHSQPCCVMFSICHSINVLISYHLSKLPMTCFIHTWHQMCAGRVLALILNTQYGRRTRQYEKNMVSLWGRTNGQRHGKSKYLAVIFLTVLWWHFIFHSTRHRTQHPTNNTFSQAEVQGLFLNHNKTRDVRA